MRKFVLAATAAAVVLAAGPFVPSRAEAMGLGSAVGMREAAAKISAVENVACWYSYRWGRWVCRYGWYRRGWYGRRWYGRRWYGWRRW